MPTALTAATASMTLPGPTGSPAARNVRAKCMRLASSRPCSGTCPLRPLAGGEGGDPSGDAMGRVRWAKSPWSEPGGARTSPRPSPPPRARRGRSVSSGTGSRLRRCSLDLHLIEDAGCFAAVQAGDVVLVFEQHAQGVVDRVRGQFQYIKLHQSFGPVDRLGDAGELEEIHRAQPLHKAHALARELLARARRIALEDLELARRSRVVHPVIEAPPLQRVMYLAGTV